MQLQVKALKAEFIGLAQPEKRGEDGDAGADLVACLGEEVG